MSAIHVRNVPESLIAALRERAEQRGHSMQQEILQILEAAATERHGVASVPPVRLVTVKTSGKTTWRREDIYSDEGR